MESFQICYCNFFKYLFEMKFSNKIKVEIFRYILPFFLVPFIFYVNMHIEFNFLLLKWLIISVQLRYQISRVPLKFKSCVTYYLFFRSFHFLCEYAYWVKFSSVKMNNHFSSIKISCSTFFSISQSLLYKINL